MIKCCIANFYAHIGYFILFLILENCNSETALDMPFFCLFIVIIPFYLFVIKKANASSSPHL